MSRNANNPDCSVTVVKLAGYDGDDHFLLPMLKGAGGLAEPLPYHFPQGKNRYHIHLSVKVFWPCLETAVLCCSGNALQIQKKEAKYDQGTILKKSQLWGKDSVSGCSTSNV